MHHTPQYHPKAGDYVRSKTGAMGHVLNWQGSDLVRVMIEQKGFSSLVVGMPSIFTPDALTLVRKAEA